MDDGSSEEHKIIFRDINDVGNVLILTHIKNEGKGSALKTGLSYIQTNISDYCIVVTDNTVRQMWKRYVRKHNGIRDI